MKRKALIWSVIPVFAVILSAGLAWSSGFELPEQNMSGLGNAYAGAAAVAENASTIFYNPAGMTQLKAREFSLGLSAIRPSFKFTNNGSTTPVVFGGGPAPGSDGGDGGSWNYVPNAYLSWALTRDLYMGLGVGVPFGLQTEYESNWVGRYQAIKFSIKTINVNPSLAYRLSDKWSLGFGLNWQRFEAEYIRQGTPAAQVRLEADDDAWGWNAGVLFQPAPATRFGFSYRAPLKYTLEGNFSGALNAPAKADLKLPDTFILSVLQTLSDRWELLGDLSLTRWSTLDTVEIVNRNTGAVEQQIIAQWKDTWRVALGASYKASDAWKLKFGIAYDQGPVPSAERRLVSLPDDNRVLFSLGTQWKPDESSALDVGLGYVYMKKTEINNDQDSPPILARGIVRGSYDNSALIAGAQYSMGF